LAASRALNGLGARFAAATGAAAAGVTATGATGAGAAAGAGAGAAATLGAATDFTGAGTGAAAPPEASFSVPSEAYPTWTETLSGKRIGPPAHGFGTRLKLVNV